MIALILTGIVAFLIVSALLARAFSASSAEQAAITAVVQAQASSDENQVLDDISGCRASPACRSRVTANIAALRHPGRVSIIQLQPSTSFSLGPTQGTARVAWSVGGSPPIVQCLRVRHVGNVFTGLRVELLELSARIPSDADCPARF